MKIDEKKIEAILKKMDTLLERIKNSEESYKPIMKNVHQDHKKSILNLIHYSEFRKFDFRSTQRKLGNLGLTRFANAHGHVLDSILKVQFLLYQLTSDPPIEFEKAKLSIKESKKILKRNTESLFGKKSKLRRVRIMVTMPTEAATDYELVKKMVIEGMNCARINCAHDSKDLWLKMINNIQKASEEIGTEVKIAMDLAGPKIRTGKVKPGARVLKFKPEKNEEGIVTKNIEITFCSNKENITDETTIPVEAHWLGQLKNGNYIHVSDARNKTRKLKIVESNGKTVTVHSKKTIYLKTGATIESSVLVKQGKIGMLPQKERAVKLHSGDILKVTKDSIMGDSALVDEDGTIIENAHISCQLSEIFKKVKPGEPILFDDGKIEGMIESISQDSFEVRITRAAPNGSKLKAEKGMNFPNTNLGISGLTEKDKIDLEFVSKYADIVNFSFVNTKRDVRELFEFLDKYEARNKLGVILKIETKFAFHNLKEILLEAMQTKDVGVMIARGDLAVETGWKNIGKVQHEILSLCAAAHIPVVWATQVLENLAKNGLPSRSEITDAVASLKAECVMLNKGPYMNEVLELLTSILTKMEDFQEKNDAMLPKIKKLEKVT